MGGVESLDVEGRIGLRVAPGLSFLQDLRFAMDLVTDAVRYAGYGVPAANLPLWFPWINGFGTNPKIETDASGSSVLSVASVTSASVTTLAARVNVGTTEVPVASVTGFNNTAKALLPHRRVFFKPELPLTGTSKIDRRALAEEAAGLIRRG